MNDAARAVLQLAIAAEQAGNLAEAVSAYDQLIAMAPDDVSVWSARGLFLGRTGRFFEAVESFRRSTQLKATYCDHYNTGNMLHALGRNDEASIEFDTALSIEPNHAEAWCNRGIALMAMGRADEARTSFDRAISIDDKMVSAYHCKAMVLQKAGDKSAAVAARRRVTELAPSAAAFIDLANTMRDGLGPQILWEPNGIEEQIVDACERALTFPCDQKQHVWCCAERLLRLQRIAHGRQSARRAGIPIEDSAAIVRYYAAAEQTFDRYPGEKYFEGMLEDAQLLKASLPL